MIDKTLILRKLTEAEEYLKQLEEYRWITMEEYSENWKTQRIVDRTLQLLIEICADIANHLISDKKWRVPVSYSDTFKVLNEEGVISDELLSVMDKMAKFRNIIVHNYDKIDAAIVVGILKTNLADFQNYREAILTWLSRDYN